MSAGSFINLQIKDGVQVKFHTDTTQTSETSAGTLTGVKVSPISETCLPNSGLGQSTVTALENKSSGLFWFPV